MNNHSNGENKSKYESLSIKEQMLGVKSSQSLPDDFYEKVLECELSLKEKFDMNILGQLIQYYSLAVEHFGSIGDEKKCEEYNENLNLLFKQMEIRKYMKEGNNIELNVKKEEIKQELKEAEKNVDYNKVIQIIKGKGSKQIKSGKSIILKEIFNQTLAFKKRLENKKKKFKSKLNIENIDTSTTSKNQKSNEKLPKLYKKNISKSTKNKKHKKIMEDLTSGLILHNSFKIRKNKKFKLTKIQSKSILNSIDPTESKEETDDLLSSIELNLCDESNSIDIKLNIVSQSSKVLPCLSKDDDISKLTEKKNFMKKIKVIISDYMQDYYNLYMKNTIDKIVKEYEKYSVNLSDELINNEVNYYNQEREMEYLRDEDDNYKEQIEGALENIKNEKEKKINEIYEKYNNNIKALKDKYILNPNNNIPISENEILKEKIKLELTKEINNCVLK